MFARTNQIALLLMLSLHLALQLGCAEVRLPRIDPSGQQIFLPLEDTTSFVPIADNASAIPGVPQPVFVKPDVPPPCPELAGTVPCPPELVEGPSIGRRRDVVRDGAIVLKPTKVIAPINADVVIFGGLCGADGFYRKRQRLEWSLSQESVGHFVEVREGSLSRLRQAFGSDVGKQGINYAVGRTSSSEELIDRGTPTVADDMLVHAGQGWVSLTSPSEGTSYVSCMAPKAEGWDRRRQTSTIHWVDANWEFPPSVTIQSGAEHTLTTLVKRASTSEAIEGWLVNYTILSGSVASGFAPAGATAAQNIRTGSRGEASIRIRQPGGQTGPGITQVQVDIIRPGRNPGDPDRLTVASSVVTIRWTSPALTFVASGPEVVGLDAPFNYRLEVFNPGDQVATNVTANAILPPGLTLISANPPAEFAGGTLAWGLGDIAPGTGSRVIELSVKATARGTHRPCFQVGSSDTRLVRLEKCLETQVSAPCLGLQVDGPETAQVGDEVVYRITMQNLCTEPLTNVRLIDTYGTGLEAPGLPSPLAYDPFDLAPSETKQIELTFIVREGGTQCHLIQVSTDGGHTAESRQCLEAQAVQRPDFRIDVESVRQSRVGERVLIRATIVNTGNTTLPEMTVLHDYTASLSPETATDGWQVVDRGLQWRLRELAPGNQVILEVATNATAADAAAMGRFTAVTEDGLQREGATNIRIEAAPQVAPDPNQGNTVPPDDDIQIAPPNRTNRLDIGITSFDEPVNPGDQVNYQVRVTNDRNQNDSNIVVTLQIPDGMRYVGGRADDLLQAESISADGRVVTMVTRRELRAGDSLDFRAIVEALTSGKKQFSVTAKSSRDPAGQSETIETTVNRR